MSGGLVLVIFLGLVGPFLVPFLSWIFGRWYQDQLMAALEVREKQHGGVVMNPNVISTSNQLHSSQAETSTLLHVSICVGPSIGQIFFMFIKSLFGGRLHSYDVVLDYGRREVLMRLQQQAAALRCTQMINVRLETSTVSFSKGSDSKRSSVEFLAFATGIR